MRLPDRLLTNYLRRFNRKHMRLNLSPHKKPHADPAKRYFLYIHVPFCEHLCPFCSFHRVKLNRELAKRYYAAVRREIDLYHDAGFNFSDVYVGGGTPTVDPEELAKTLQLLHNLTDIQQASVETNPNHLTAAVTQQLLDAGVKRLSVGVQSLDDNLLKEMGRYQAYGNSTEIITNLKRTQGKFATLNVDMIFNLPHQDLNSLKTDIKILKEIAVDQISWYPLMPAASTAQNMTEKMGALDFSRERAFYYTIRNGLAPDYQPGSAWCFANKTSAIDEYIVTNDEYLGIGSGAFSYINGTIYANTFSINHYLELINQGETSISAHQELSIKDRARYDLLMKLFGLSMDKPEMRGKYNPDYRKLLRKELLLFKILGALKETNGTIKLTEKGLYWWVLMMREFFTGINNFRQQMRKLELRAGPKRSLYF